MNGGWIRVLRVAGLTVLGVAGFVTMLYGLAMLAFMLSWDADSTRGWLAVAAMTTFGIAVLIVAIYYGFRRDSRRETWRDWHPHN